MRTRARGVVLPAALVAGAFGCGGRQTEPAPSPAAGGMSAAEYEAVYRARVDSARQRFTAADVAFMTGMIAHHAQALEMSALAPANGASPVIRTLAARIINGQRDEIATMQRWLRSRGQAVPEVHVEGTTVMVHGGEHGHHMPGMLTPEQMRELAEARGVRFDRLFLEYMIQHHRGALTMVEQLFATDGAAQDQDAFKFATAAQVDQGTEIARMEKLLAAMPPGAD